MLAQAKKLNPDCAFVQGGMRKFKLGQTFEAVLIDYAISFVNCKKDFEAAFRNGRWRIGRYALQDGI